MKKLIFLFLFTGSVSFVMAQPGPAKDTSWKKQYRETATKINDLVHTKLEVKPDFSKSYLYGKAWITLQPHFYPTDSLNLDAKGMAFNKIAIVRGTQQVPLKYEYDDWNLRIKLDRTYRSNESYTIYIDYTAKPDEFEAKVFSWRFPRYQRVCILSIQKEKIKINLPRYGHRVKQKATQPGSHH